MLPGEHTNNKRKKKKEKKTWFRKRTEINWQKRRQHKMSCVFIALLLDGVILAIIVIAAHGYQRLCAITGESLIVPLGEPTKIKTKKKQRKICVAQERNKRRPS